MDAFKTLTMFLAAGVEGAAAVVIGLAALETFAKALQLFVRRRATNDVTDSRETIRLSLGRWLAVALELELGADILRTAVAPTWTEIGQLGAIVVLRTTLNYFLQLEISKTARAQGPDTSPVGG